MHWRVEIDCGFISETTENDILVVSDLVMAGELSY
jgi:hypothetical protein